MRETFRSIGRGDQGVAGPRTIAWIANAASDGHRAMRTSHGLAWICSGLLSVAATAVLVRPREPATATDSLNGCEIGRVPETEFAVLVDPTDPIPVSQTSRLGAILKHEIGGLQRGDLVSIFELAVESPSLPTRVWAQCLPARGREVDGRLEGTRFAERRFAERVDRPVKSYVESLTARQPAANTPLLTSLAGITDRRLGACTGTAKCKLAIVSDFLENSAMSHYRGPLPKAEEVVARYRLNLKGIDVAVVYLLRHGTPLQGRKHLDWWISVVEQAGGRVTSVEILGQSE